MLGPVLCGSISGAPLLPKLRGHFAEFLNNASPAGLRLLALPTCVGLRYGYGYSYSGFSWHILLRLRYFYFAPISHSTSGGLLSPPMLCPFTALSIRGSGLVYASPHLLCIRSTGFSTCYPSATRLRLALGPGFPRVDQLYPGNLRFSAWKILTSISLLIPAFSLHISPPLLSVWLLPYIDAPLPIVLTLSHGFGGVFQPRVFSARDLSASELLRTL